LSISKPSEVSVGLAMELLEGVGLIVDDITSPDVLLEDMGLIVDDTISSDELLGGVWLITDEIE